MKFGAVLAATVLVVPAMAMAEKEPLDVPAEPSVQTSSAENQADAEKKVCRTEKVTGSRTKRNRVCMTQAEWDELADQTMKNMSDFSRASGRAPKQSSPFGGPN